MWKITGKYEWGRIANHVNYKHKLRRNYRRGISKMHKWPHIEKKTILPPIAKLTLALSDYLRNKQTTMGANLKEY